MSTYFTYCPECGIKSDVPNGMEGASIWCGTCGRELIAQVEGRTIESECPHCHAIYEVESSELGTVEVCLKCKKKFTVTERKLSQREKLLALEIKTWELENARALETWKREVVRWEERVAAQKAEYQKELVSYERSKLSYVEYLQEGGLLRKCDDDIDFSPKRGEIVYRRVSNVALEESRSIRRTESHRSAQRDVHWGYDDNGRNRRLGDSYGYTGKSESKTDYEFQSVDTGSVYVTNLRFLFIGQQQQRILSFDKIISFEYDWIQEGGSIKVRAENRQRAMRFTGGDFYEFALVMKVIRDLDFRKFLLSGLQGDVKRWLDDHNAFPNWMAPKVPQQPKVQPKPEMPSRRPKPTLRPPKWLQVLLAFIHGVKVFLGDIAKSLMGDPVVQVDDKEREELGLPKTGKIHRSDYRAAHWRKSRENLRAQQVKQATEEAKVN